MRHQQLLGRLAKATGFCARKECGCEIVQLSYESRQEHEARLFCSDRCARLERVARALWEVRRASHESIAWHLGYKIPKWDDLPGGTQEVMEKEARAAIEAMKEPTEAMQDWGRLYWGQGPSMLWTGMINAALQSPVDADAKS